MGEFVELKSIERERSWREACEASAVFPAAVFAGRSKRYIARGGVNNVETRSHGSYLAHHTKIESLSQHE